MANANRLLATREVRIQPQRDDVKSIRVRMTVAGYLPVERTPELVEEGGSGASH